MTASGIDVYWRYEKWIRDREGRYGSVPGATGALYAIRRELARPISPQSILDDVLIPMHAIAQGYRCVFEPGARIYDRPAQDSSREAIRKRRTLAGNVQLLLFHPRWCLPGGHPIAWQYLSHKIARLFSPLLLATAFLASACLSSAPFFAALTLAQAAFYGLGVLGQRVTPPGRIPRLALGIARVFVMMQVSILRGWIDALTRRDLARWDKA